MIVLYAKDKKDSLAIRTAARPDHVKHLTKLQEAGEIAFAGPLLDDKNEKMIGSLVVFTSDDIDKVKSFINEDPYTEAGLFASVELNFVKRVF